MNQSKGAFELQALSLCYACKLAAESSPEGKQKSEYSDLASIVKSCAEDCTITIKDF